MKLVVQRVNKATVTMNRKVVGEIGKGLFVLLGVSQDDDEKDADMLAEKLFKLRVMADEKDKMNLSVKDVEGSFLVVSQFTLYADTSKGNRPSFVKAAEPEKAKGLYEYFVDKLKKNGIKVKTGSFGDYMKIDAEFDGPVTILFDSGR